MDEIIVRVVRIIACLARLRILSCLMSEDEMTPKDMGRKLRMKPDVVCAHLRRLSSMGLVLTRRSGVWCYCKARSPYTEEAFSGRVMAWLRGALADPSLTLRNCGVGQLRNSSSAAAHSEVHRLLFEAATAFANLRRLQILRLLGKRDDATVETVIRELKMSESAVCRHMDKLIRRGYVEASRKGYFLAYRLASEFKTPLHGKLLAIVRATWVRN